MNRAPCAKFNTPSVPRMMVSPLLTSASMEPRARPLKAWDNSSGRLGMAVVVFGRA